MTELLPWLQQTGRTALQVAALVLALAIAVGAFAVGMEIGEWAKAHEEGR